MPKRSLWSLAVPSSEHPARSDKTELLEAVAAEIHALPERLQQLIELKIYGENGKFRTNKDIGEQLGLSSERVRQLLGKAFHLLRPRLKSLLQDNRD